MQCQHCVFPSFSRSLAAVRCPEPRAAGDGRGRLEPPKRPVLFFKCFSSDFVVYFSFYSFCVCCSLLALKFLPVKGHSSLCFPTSSPLTKPQSGMCGGPRPQGRLAAGEGSGPAQASPVTPVLLASAHGHLTGLWPAGLVLVTYPWILHGCESYSYSVQGQGNLRGFSWVVLACGLHEVSIKLPARATVIRRLDQSRRVHFRGGSLSRPRGGVAGRLEASRPRL